MRQRSQGPIASDCGDRRGMSRSINDGVGVERQLMTSWQTSATEEHARRADAFGAAECERDLARRSSADTCHVAIWHPITSGE